MDNLVYGFAAEPNGKYWLISPATKSEDGITCHDLAGFLGHWKLKEGGVFFPSISGESLCNATLSKAQEYVNQQKENKI